MGFVALAGVFIFGIICWMLVDEKYCIWRIEEETTFYDVWDIRQITFKKLDLPMWLIIYTKMIIVHVYVTKMDYCQASPYSLDKRDAFIYYSPYFLQHIELLQSAAHVWTKHIHRIEKVISNWILSKVSYVLPVSWCFCVTYDETPHGKLAKWI